MKVMDSGHCLDAGEPVVQQKKEEKIMVQVNLTEMRRFYYMHLVSLRPHYALAE